MLFKNLESHDGSISKLEKLLENRSFSGSYIFKGPATAGKLDVARKVAKYLTCKSSELEPTCRCSSCRKFPTNPDFIEIDNGRDAIKEEDLNIVSSFISLVPFESPRRVVLIRNAENLNNTASNKLLKLIEQDNSNAVFILLAVDTSKIIPTVVSRCKILSLDSYNSALEDKGVSSVNQRLLKRLSTAINENNRIIESPEEYLKASEYLPIFFRAIEKGDNVALLEILEKIYSYKLISVFVDVMLAYIVDINKTIYSVTDNIVYVNYMDDIIKSSEIWTPEVCFVLVDKLSNIKKIESEGLNIDLKVNVLAAAAWVTILLNKKRKDGK